MANKRRKTNRRVLSKIYDEDTWSFLFSMFYNFIPPWGISAIRHFDLPNPIRTHIAEYAAHDGVINLFEHRDQFVTKPIAFWSHIRKLLHIQSHAFVPKHLTNKWCIEHLCTQCQTTIGANPHLILQKRVCRCCQQMYDLQPIHVHHAFHQYFLNHTDIRSILHTPSSYVYLKDVITISIRKHQSMENIQLLRKIRQQDEEAVQQLREQRRARLDAARQRRRDQRILILRREITVTLHHINYFQNSNLTTNEIWNHPLCIEEREAYVRWGHTTNMHLSKAGEVARYLCVRAKHQSAGEYYQFIKKQMNWAQTVRYLHHVRLGIYCDRCRLSYAQRDSPYCLECHTAHPT